MKWFKRRNGAARPSEEKKKKADIDEQFDWHTTRGTYQMREDPGDGRRSD